MELNKIAGGARIHDKEAFCFSEKKVVYIAHSDSNLRYQSPKCTQKYCTFAKLYKYVQINGFQTQYRQLLHGNKRMQQDTEQQIEQTDNLKQLKKEAISIQEFINNM